MAELQMRFLGTIDLAIDGRPLDGLKSKKAIALLSYLAVTGATHDRLALATLLWADRPEPNALKNLRQVVADLRKVIGPYLVITSRTLALDANSPHWADIRILEEAANKTTIDPGDGLSLDYLQGAVDLYQGDFMAGFYVRNAPLFEEWSLSQQTRLRELVLNILTDLGNQYAKHNQLPEAINTTRRLLQLEPWREEAHRQLMQFLALDGRRSEALAQFEICRQVLDDEFGVEPAMATVSLWEEIRDKRFESPAVQPVDEQAATVEAHSQPPPSPYRGLLAFREQDGDFFFGREALTEQLLTMARRQPLIAIIGSSGSGKSSLAAAGLVAGLRAEPGWRIAVFRPGSQPLAALAAALVQQLDPQLSQTDRLVEAGKMAAALREGVLTLGSVVERINQLEEPAGQLLLLADQFEELYTLCADDEERELFLSELLDAANRQLLRSKPALCLGLTMRADFMEQALASRPLADALQDSLVILGPMSRDELSRAIEKPAEVQGVEFEAGLVTRIVEDVGLRSGHLPLLEFALTKLWEEQRGWRLTHQAYAAIGQVEGALALYAEDVYAQLPARDQAAARRVFTQMVRPGGRTEDTRRLAARHEIGDSDWLLVRRLADARLVVTGRDPVGKETAELAHEALIVAWDRLQKWLAEDRAFRLWQERLRSALGAWQASDGDEAALLRGRLLAEAEGWLEEQASRLSMAERTFIAQSQAYRERKATEREEARLAQERARRRIIVGLTTLLLIAVAALVFALVQNHRAEAQARLASTRELTSAAVSNLEANPELSTLLALQALQTTYEADGIILPATEQVLHQAVQSSRVLLSLPQGGGLAFDPDGTRLAAGGEDGSVVIVDAQTGKAQVNLEGLAEPVTGIAFAPDGRMLAAVGERRQVLVWDVVSRQVVMELPGVAETGPVLGSTTVAFSPDGRFLLLAGPAEDTTILEMASGQKVVHVEDSATADAAFSPDGRRLALAAAVWELPVEFWDGAKSAAGKPMDPLLLNWDDRLFDLGDAILEIQNPSSNVSAYQNTGSVVYSLDGKSLLTSVISSLVVVLDAANGHVQTVLRGHGGIIHSIATGPDGKRVATASADGTARVWNVETGEVLLALEGHQDEVVAVAFHPDGDRLATSSLDGTTRLWDISANDRGEWSSLSDSEGEVLLAFAEEQANLIAAFEEAVVSRISIPTQTTVYRVQPRKGRIKSLALDSEGARLALGFADGGLVMLDAITGKLLHEHESGVSITTLAFSPDGRYLVTGDAAGDLKVWDSEGGQALAIWDAHDSFVNGLVFSPDGERLTTASADGNGFILEADALLRQQIGDERPSASSDVPPEAKLAALVGHRDLIVSLSANRDGSRLVTASWDGTAAVWDANSGESLLTLDGHKGQVMDAAFTPDGARIATAGTDGQVIIWDAGSGAQLFVLASPNVPLTGLEFSQDGRYLGVAGDDGTIRLYAPLAEDLMNIAVGRLNRNLTQAECERYLHVETCP